MDPTLLAALLMGGGPKLSPFVRDTVFPAVGGQFPINYAKLSPYGPGGIVAITDKNEQGEPATKVYQEPTEHELAHEAGHVLDYRGLANQPFADADYAREKHGTNKWYGKNREEYGAEAFANAIESGRKGFADSTNVEKKTPGALSFIHWLLTRPPFNAQASK